MCAEEPEQYATSQIKMICDNEASQGSIIRIMPDVHPGKVGPVGLTMTVTDRILPALVGADIGCGILAICVGNEYSGAAEPLFRKSGNRLSGIGNRRIA